MVTDNNTLNETRLTDEEAMKLFGAMEDLHVLGWGDEQKPTTVIGVYNDFKGLIMNWNFVREGIREEHKIERAYKVMIQQRESLIQVYSQTFDTLPNGISDIYSGTVLKHLNLKRERTRNEVAKARGLIAKLK